MANITIESPIEKKKEYLWELAQERFPRTNKDIEYGGIGPFYHSLSDQIQMLMGTRRAEIPEIVEIYKKISPIIKSWHFKNGIYHQLERILYKWFNSTMLAEFSLLLPQRLDLPTKSLFLPNSFYINPTWRANALVHAVELDSLLSYSSGLEEVI